MRGGGQRTRRQHQGGNPTALAASACISAAVVPGAGEAQAQAETTGFNQLALFQRVYPKKAARMQAFLALVSGASSLLAFSASPATTNLAPHST